MAQMTGHSLYMRAACSLSHASQSSLETVTATLAALQVAQTSLEKRISFHQHLWQRLSQGQHQRKLAWQLQAQLCRLRPVLHLSQSTQHLSGNISSQGQQGPSGDT